MGWSSGTDLVERVAVAVKNHVAEASVRKKLYKALVDAATDMDWDCLNEVEGIDPILDQILETYYD